MSTMFLLLVGLTVALLVLTPLKFYIPGYGKKENKTELQLLKLRTDSLQQELHYKQQYLDGLKRVLGNDKTAPRDTASLKVSKAEISND